MEFWMVFVGLGLALLTTLLVSERLRLRRVARADAVQAAHRRALTTEELAEVCHVAMRSLWPRRSDLEALFVRTTPWTIPELRVALEAVERALRTENRSRSPVDWYESGLMELVAEVDRRGGIVGAAEESSSRLRE